MRKNTGSRTVTTTNFVTLPGETQAASAVWAPELADQAEGIIGDYADDHLVNNLDAHGYRMATEVWIYELPGLTVTALVIDGRVLTVFEISDDAAARFHYAARKSFPVTITYTRADGTETVRTIEPTALRLTKAGDVTVKAMDRDSSEARTFRLDRVSLYTVHRTRPTVRTEAPAPSKAELVEAFAAAQRTWEQEDRRIAASPAPCEHSFHRHHVGQPYRCRRCDAVKLFRTDGVGTVTVTDAEYRRMRSLV